MAIPDFNLKSGLSPESIVAAYQKKHAVDAAQEAASKEREMQSWQGVAQETGKIVGLNIAASKERQKRDLINSLAESLATSSALTPDKGPAKTISSMVPPTQTASFSPTTSDAVRDAVKVNPMKASELFLKDKLVDPRASGGRGGFSSKNYLDKNGQVRVGIFNTQTGEFVQSPNDPIAGYAPKMTYDEFGNPIMTPAAPGSGAVPVPTPADSSSSTVGKTQDEIDNNAIPALRAKAPKIAEDFDAAYKKAFPQNNPELSTAVLSTVSAKTVEDILKSKDVSQTALAGLGFHLARMSGSNSQLSDNEREIFQEPLGLLDKLTNKGYKIAVGDLSPKMKADLLKLAETLKRKELVRGHQMILSAKRQAKGVTGKYWNNGLSKQFPTMDDLINSSDEDMQQPAGEVDELAQILGLKKKEGK